MKKTVEDRRAAMAEEQEAYDAKYQGRPLKKLAENFWELEQQLEAMKEAATTLQKESDYLRYKAIPEKADEEGIENLTFKVPGGKFRMGLQGDIHASIRKEKMDDAFEWLEDNGHGGLIKPTVNASSLKAAVKEMIRNDGAPPEELFSVLPFTRATLTRVE